MVQKHHLQGHVNIGVILLFYNNFDSAYNATQPNHGWLSSIESTIKIIVK